MAKASIGIIGVGVVGGAVAEYYKAQPDQPLFLFDKFKKVGSMEEVSAADYIFICLPTPTRDDGSQDLSALEEVMKALPAGKTAIIKSTVLPGTTERFQKERPDLTLFHNPEFLDAKTAGRDFAAPDIQVLGVTEKSAPRAGEVMALLPPARQMATCRAGESEMVKYFLNSFMAAKNTFANQMYDYCRAKGINYDAVKDIVKLAPRMGGEVHLKVLMDGYRGFGGACLPKDTSALIHDAETAGAPLELLALVKKLNKGYIDGNVSKYS
jgi:UDPglucose 6-dehydrogenase